MQGKVWRLNIPRCRLGEGPLWDGAEKRLIVTDIEGKQLHFLDWERNVCHTLKLPQKAGFVALAEEGLALGLEDGAYLLSKGKEKAAEVRREDLVRLHPEEKLCGERFNDGKAGPDGRLYGGTIERSGEGKLYRISRGKMETMLEHVSISNGLAWSGDGRRMYYCDTATERVDVLEFDRRTGEGRNRRSALEFAGLRGRPDGLCIDAEEKLWVAVWGEGAVYRGDPETGKWERAVEVPCASHSSSCAFAGQELEVLVITTGQVEGEEGSGYTYAAQVGTRGRAPYVYGGEEKGNEE